METGKKVKNITLDEQTTSCTDFAFLEELLNEDGEPEERDYILNTVRDLAQDARDLTELINNTIDKRNNLKTRGLTYFKDAIAKGHRFTVYKVFREPDEELKNIYYYSFNGCYAIEWKQIIRTRERATDIERELKQVYNINVY